MAVYIINGVVSQDIKTLPVKSGVLSVYGTIDSLTSSDSGIGTDSVTPWRLRVIRLISAITKSIRLISSL